MGVSEQKGQDLISGLHRIPSACCAENGQWGIKGEAGNSGRKTLQWSSWMKKVPRTGGNSESGRSSQIQVCLEN